MFGVGGGIVMVPLLIWFLAMDQRHAAATSLAAIVPGAIAGSVSYLVNGHLDVLAGVLIAAAAILRLGRYLAYIPWPVVEGFTLGIAVIIALQQVPNALGVAKPAGENTAVVAARALDEAVAHPNPPALGLTALVVLVMVVAPRVHRALPSSLLGVLAATVVAAVADLDVATIGLPQRVVHLSVPHLAAGDLDQYLSAAFAIAALAAIESLLSAKVADGMADGRRHDPDRELLGQGVANVVSPLLGGMPATGAIARTAVNVRAGARSRVAAAVHALVLVLVVLFAAPLVAEIPLAALAGVLLVTAARMVDVHNVRAVLRSTRSDAIVLVVTALATVVFDLIVAVEFGVAIAAVLALRHV
ncbi:MAG: TSUP family transporter, partial [Actinobacteria bacterium]|nr:TSUP family transporter [Actinomycetota bacterium]